MKKALLCGLVIVLWASTASAHKPSDSYLTLRPQGSQLDGQWDIALRDLDHVLGLDADRDGAITWGELRARRDAIAAYALARFEIQADDSLCSTRATEQLVDHHTDGAYAVLRFTVDCHRQPRRLGLRYGLFFDVDPQHRGLLQIATAGETGTLVFSPDQPIQRLDLSTLGSGNGLWEFWRDGVTHGWSGYEHVLFLLALLLPAVLRREAGRWCAASFRGAILATLKVVTAFTLAHSITLCLAALGVVHVPARWVECAIVASVAVAALNNAWPFFGDSRWLVAFAFGLLHGFGFASVLADLSPGAVASVLLGFNAGVETGLLMIVSVFLPLAYFARRSWLYQRLTLFGGSFAVALSAAVWLVERALS